MSKKIGKKEYEAELAELQIELNRIAHWVQKNGKRVVVLVEGRQRRRNFRHQSPHEQPLLPDRGAGKTDRYRIQPMVFPALSGAPAGSR
jgi:hypothetical protein